MKYYFYILLFVLSLSCCYRQPNIYNDGTAWKMPGNLKVSDFYYDIENAYQYKGEHQEKYLKVKSFFWQDKNNIYPTIESAFFIVKKFATGGGVEYALQYRRYIIFNNEREKSPEINNMWYEDNKLYIQRGATLYLGDSDNDKFAFGMPHSTVWQSVDGYFESYTFSMFFERAYTPIFNHIMNNTEIFVFNFPSENLETHGFILEDDELEEIKTNGNIIELENNLFSLTIDEIENIRKELSELLGTKKQEPKIYLEQVWKDSLK